MTAGAVVNCKTNGVAPPGRGAHSTGVEVSCLAGGECQYFGCVPSKTLLRPMGLAAEVSRMPGLELRGPIDTAVVLAARQGRLPPR